MRWADVKGYEGIYTVSDHGDVKSLSRSVPHSYSGTITISERILRPGPCGCGYLQVNLAKDGVNKAAKVHRLVAEAFIPNTDNKPQVNHKNGDKADNRVENLEWVSASGNIRHAYDSGYHDQHLAKMRKLTDEQVRLIRSSKQPHSAIAFEYGVSQSTVQAIKQHKRYKEIA